jgi:hypothetical protein
MGLWLTYAGGIVAFLVQFVLFLRWLHRRMRDDEIMRVFVRDIATKHLPHIYEALREIAEVQGVNLENPPQIQFVDFGKRAG